MSTPQTSAALYNLVLRAMHEMGLLDNCEGEPVHGEARVPHEQKRSLLRTVFERSGANSILSIGRKILSYQSILAIAVLSRTTSPTEIIRRWQRLEKIYHSRHRIVLLDQGNDWIAVRHKAIHGPPPEKLDDLLIAGIVLALLEKQGCLELVGTFENGDVFSRNGQLCLRHTDGSEDYSTWRFNWTVLSKEQGDPPDVPSSKDIGLASLIEAVFLVDSADSWTLEKFSARCGLSSRTFQRRLADEGTSIQVLLRQFRANAAASMLVEIDASLTEIAFACGYSDQPHFSREFKRCIGMTPNTYRGLAAA